MAGQRNETVIGTVNSFSLPSSSINVETISTSGVIDKAYSLKAIESLPQSQMSSKPYVAWKAPAGLNAALP